MHNPSPRRSRRIRGVHARAVIREIEPSDDRACRQRLPRRRARSPIAEAPVESPPMKPGIEVRVPFASRRHAMHSARRGRFERRRSRASIPWPLYFSLSPVQGEIASSDIIRDQMRMPLMPPASSRVITEPRSGRGMMLVDSGLNRPERFTLIVTLPSRLAAICPKRCSVITVVVFPLLIERRAKIFVLRPPSEFHVDHVHPWPSPPEPPSVARIHADRRGPNRIACLRNQASACRSAHAARADRRSMTASGKQLEIGEFDGRSPSVSSSTLLCSGERCVPRSHRNSDRDPAREPSSPTLVQGAVIGVARAKTGWIRCGILTSERSEKRRAPIERRVPVGERRRSPLPNFTTRRPKIACFGLGHTLRHAHERRRNGDRLERGGRESEKPRHWRTRTKIAFGGLSRPIPSPARSGRWCTAENSFYLPRIRGVQDSDELQTGHGSFLACTLLK